MAFAATNMLPTWGPVDLKDPVDSAHPLALGLLTWWLALPGWAGGNKFWDVMGLNHGTATAATAGTGWQSTTCPGHFACLSGNGTNRCNAVVTPGSMPVNGLSAATVAVWARCTAQQAAATSLGGLWDGSSTNLLGVILNNAASYKAQVKTTGGTFSATNSVAYADGLWHCYMAVFNGTTLTLYQDGLQVATAAGVSGTLSSANRFLLGSNTTTTVFIAGQFDDAALWGQALTAAQAVTWFQLGRQGYPGLLNRVALWPNYTAAGPSATTQRRRGRKAWKREPVFDYWRRGAP